MGQSVSITALSAGSAGINVRELDDLQYEKTLSSARFMKCIRARHEHGLVLVKVVMRPPPDFKLTPYAVAIKRQRDLLADVPNAIGYQRTVETENCGYLVRQYLHSSLYDRISTRPFLDDIEKKWLAFQLLCALRDCHARNVYHGDIKTENLLVTSWNWLYLTDFSSAFKKTYLPEDNPADFSYFFDISGRRTCYLAPERFLSAGEEDDGGGVTWAMDIFSAGCVIAELFVETPIFSLSQLFKYRQGEYSPSATHLHRIQDTDVRELITHMIQIEPEARYSAEEYLNFWRRKAFPEYFYSFLHQYMGTITDPSSGRRPVIPNAANFGEADDRIDRVFYDFDKISYFLGYDENSETLKPSTSHLAGRSYSEILPVQIDIPNNRHIATRLKRSTGDDGTLIFLTLVLSALRNTARSISRVRACDLLLAFGERVTDEAKLDRILPYLVVLLTDKADMVKIAALRSMTQLLALVEVVSPVNGYVFTEYIRPRLTTLIQSQSYNTNPAIRATCASCLASLAHTSLRILEVVQALRADGSIPTLDPEAENGAISNAAYRNIYDVGKSELIEHFETYTKTLLEDPDASVRRAFLGSVSSLCVFFGSPKANDVILSHLNTYLNDKDWMLKCAFLETIVGVATYVGSSSLEEFILPLMLQALSDPEEFVVEKVLRSFANMAELGLFQRSTTWELVDVVARFLIHPNIWIRESSAHFVTASTKFLSRADIRCIIVPLIQPYLKMQLTQFTETTLLDALKRPLPRSIMDMAGTWYQKADQGLFWKTPHGQQTFSFGPSDRTVPTISSKDLNSSTMQKIPKAKEDDQWLDRLRNLGMSTEDEIKLLALRDYIQRTVSRRAKEDHPQDASHLNSIQKIQEMGIFPITIFFDKQQSISSPRERAISVTAKHHSITDALLDASKPDEALAFRKQTIANNRRERERRTQDEIDIPNTTARSRRESSNLSSPISASPHTRAATSEQVVAHEIAQQLSDNGEMHGKGSSTPTDSSDGQKARIQHRSSAMSLLNRRGTPKTVAATSTDATNAVGEMDAPHSVSGSPREQSDFGRQNGTATPEIQTGHSYKGADPHVRGLLDNLANESYQVDEHDFGPIVTPVNRKRRHNDSSEPEMPWRPQGVHVATFGEHAGPINRILPSPDHLFFITASDDGTVRVWDSLRLERNLIHKSRQTHKHAEGAQVKCVTFVENTHTFVSCATDGIVNVVKVDCVQSSESIKYGKLRVKRAYKLPGEEFATWCEHFRIDGRSTLLLATSASRILAIDLRTMATIYTLKVPLQYGIPLAFCLDRKRNWLLLGTSRGVLSLYDLRFRLSIKAWSLSGGTPIRRLFLHPAKGRGKWVCVVGGTAHADITVWDIEKTQCKDVFRAPPPSSNSPSGAGDASMSQQPETEELRSLARTYEPLPPTDPDFSSPPSYTADVSAPDLSTVRAAVAGSDAGPEDREARYGFLLAGGTDRRVRFWDLVRPEASATVSGLASDETQPRIASVHPVPGLAVHMERPGGDGREVQGKSRERDRIERTARQKVSRTVQIAKEQKALLRGHLDHILDVTVLDGQSAMMVLSVDRRGCVFVFQ